MSAPQLSPKMINPNVPAIPFGREVAVELRKMAGTISARVLLILLALIWVITAVFLLVVRGGPEFTVAMEALGFASRIFIGLLTVLLVTSEWGQRAVMSVFTLEPRRERVIGAKLCAALIAAFTMFVLTVAIAAVITAIRGGSFDNAGAGLTYIGIRALFDVLLAFAMAIAILNTAGAIVGYLVLPDVIMPILLGLAALVGSGASTFDSLAPWIYPQQMFTGLSQVEVAGEAWVHLLVCAVIWIGVPAIIGTYRIMTTEVK